MEELKNNIIEEIASVACIDASEVVLEMPKDTANGDFAFPCFRLSKTMRKAPVQIAEELKEKLIKIEGIEKIDSVNGYLNFFAKKEGMVKSVLLDVIQNKENYGKTNVGKGENVVVDYSSPNIAKPFHIGHLRSTVIGKALYNIYNHLGYNSVGVNHLGDWGTQFGKLIEGYKRWGTEYNIEENPIDELTKIYIRINAVCKEDETALDACRENFKKLEENDPYCVELWEKFRSLSLKEFDRIYKILGCTFDSLNGEAFYSDKMDEVTKLLEDSGKLVESKGARIIDLEAKKMPPCIVGKTNGSTTYATRDLAAIIYRARTYNFAKAVYLTSYEQILHFKQVFEVAKLLKLDPKYTDNLVHVPFGMVHLKTGKMSTREGNIVKLEDLINEAVAKVEAVIEAKNPDLEDKKETARKIGVGAIIFNDLKNARIKDEIFDLDEMLKFEGETGPYVQYTYVRTQSIIEKAGYVPNIEEIDFSKLEDKDSIEVIKNLAAFKDAVANAAKGNEPSVVARYVVTLAQSYSAFYNNNKIMNAEKTVKDARLVLTIAVGIVIKLALSILGIECPEKM
ncbi:MAG: arginine--tRNA ligase [Clostridia bacterium]